MKIMENLKNSSVLELCSIPFRLYRVLAGSRDFQWHQKRKPSVLHLGMLQNLIFHPNPNPDPSKSASARGSRSMKIMENLRNWLVLELCSIPFQLYRVLAGSGDFLWSIRMLQMHKASVLLLGILQNPIFHPKSSPAPSKRPNPPRSGRSRSKENPRKISKFR